MRCKACRTSHRFVVEDTRVVTVRIEDGDPDGRLENIKQTVRVRCAECGTVQEGADAEQCIVAGGCLP